MNSMMELPSHETLGYMPSMDAIIAKSTLYEILRPFKPAHFFPDIQANTKERQDALRFWSEERLNDEENQRIRHESWRAIEDVRKEIIALYGYHKAEESKKHQWWITKKLIAVTSYMTNCHRLLPIILLINAIASFTLIMLIPIFSKPTFIVWGSTCMISSVIVYIRT